MIRRMETKLALKYNGPAVDDGRMDVYQAAANMIAFSEFMVVATKLTFGDKAEAKAEVAGFGKGSFLTNLLFSVSGEAATIFSMMPVEHLLEVVKEAFELWKHLKGKPPTQVAYGPQAVTVENNNGEIIQIQTQSLHLVMNEKAAAAVERFVNQALSAPGMETISLQAGNQKVPLAWADRSEASYFVPVAPSESITDTTTTMGLVIESPSFKDGNKWKVWDGAQSTLMEMKDEEFIHHVNSGARFGKGDTLIAEVRLVQKRLGTKLEAERTIVRVLEHKPGPTQQSLLV